MESKNKLTRVEVIDHTGRAYVNWNNNNFVEVSYQDEGRTLKIFISNNMKSKDFLLDALQNTIRKGDKVFVPAVNGRFVELRLKTITYINKGVVVTGDTSHSPEDVILKTK